MFILLYCELACVKNFNHILVKVTIQQLVTKSTITLSPWYCQGVRHDLESFNGVRNLHESWNHVGILRIQIVKLFLNFISLLSLFCCFLYAIDHMRDYPYLVNGNLKNQVRNLGIKPRFQSCWIKLIMLEPLCYTVCIIPCHHDTTLSQCMP